MLPSTLGRITIEAAGADAAADPGRQAAVARCCVCGVESPETVDAKSLDHVRHAASNVATYLCPERGHGRLPTLARRLLRWTWTTRSCP